MEDIKDELKCPLCGSNCKYEDDRNVPIWICDSCPFVGFEFVNDIDASILFKRLVPKNILD